MRRFLGRAWIPTLLVMVAVPVAAILSYRLTPPYTATATVVAKQEGSNNLGRTLDFTDIAISNVVASRALRDASIKESVDELQGQLSITSTRSDMYRVSVSDATPDRAVALANAVSHEAASLYQELALGPSDQIASALQADVSKALARYVAASQALIDFDALHPNAEPGKIFPALAVERLRLQLDQQAASQSYLNLNANFAQARVQQVTNAQNFSAELVDEAVARPNTRARMLKVAYAGGLSLVLGIGLIVLLETVPRRRRLEALRQAVTR